MGFARCCSRRSVSASVALLLLTTACSQYGSGFPTAAGTHARSVDVLEADDVTIPIRTMERFIANRLPGILIRGRSIVVRGTSTFSSTNEALIVVDGRGMPTGVFLNMNPAEVERIEVLRGGEAAFYGRRGANGVIVVSTRQ